jgi:hypothetical protein
MEVRKATSDLQKKCTSTDALFAPIMASVEALLSS